MLFSAVYIEFYPRRSLRSNVRTFQSKLHRSSGAKIPPAPICPVRIGTSWGLWTLALNPLSATLMNLPRKCCKQKTYSFSKTFRCNTYKNTGGGVFFPTGTTPLANRAIPATRCFRGTQVTSRGSRLFSKLVHLPLPTGVLESEWKHHDS